MAKLAGQSGRGKAGGTPALPGSQPAFGSGYAGLGRPDAFQISSRILRKLANRGTPFRVQP